MTVLQDLRDTLERELPTGFELDLTATYDAGSPGPDGVSGAIIFRLAAEDIGFVREVRIRLDGDADSVRAEIAERLPEIVRAAKLALEERRAAEREATRLREEAARQERLFHEILDELGITRGAVAPTDHDDHGLPGLQSDPVSRA